MFFARTERKNAESDPFYAKSVQVKNKNKNTAALKNIHWFFIYSAFWLFRYHVRFRIVPLFSGIYL